MWNPWIDNEPLPEFYIDDDIILQLWTNFHQWGIMLNNLYSLWDHVVDNNLCRKNVIDDGGYTPHKPCSSYQHKLTTRGYAPYFYDHSLGFKRFFGVFLKLIVDRNNTLRSQFLNFCLPIVLPKSKKNKFSCSLRSGTTRSYQSATKGVFLTRMGRPV